MVGKSRIWVVVGVVLLGLMVVTACQKEEVSDEKFMTIQQQYPKDIFSSNMIEKIHADRWTITYGFYDNPDSKQEDFEPCANDYKKHQKNVIEQKIKNELLKWLAPLTDDDVEIASGEKLITESGFKFTTTDVVTVGEDHKNHEMMEKQHGKLVLADGAPQPDLGIIFYCMRPDEISSSVDAMSYKDEGYPLVHMFPYPKEKRQEKYNAPDLDDDAFLTPNRKYLKFTLLHELGHTFGLADTYGSSTGGNIRTVGTQPLSIMASSEFWRVMNFPKGVDLTPDDRKGMKWLYAYHHRRGQLIDSCPEGYTYKEGDETVTVPGESCTIEATEVASATDASSCVPSEKEKRFFAIYGCVPSHPVIFAVKQGRLAVLENLLDDDETVNINERDELGNTPLHYAVMHEKRHGGGRLCQYLLEKEARCNILNKEGSTPYTLYPKSKCLNQSKERVLLCQAPGVNP